MTDAISLIGFAFLMLVGLLINSIAWWKERWWVMPISFLWWGGLGYWCSGQSDAYKTGGGAIDHYRLFMWLCVLMMIVSVGEVWALYQRTKDAEVVEDDMATRTRKRVETNLTGTFCSPQFQESKAKARNRRSGGFPPRSTGQFPPKPR